MKIIQRRTPEELFDDATRHLETMNSLEFRLQAVRQFLENDRLKIR